MRKQLRRWAMCLLPTTKYNWLRPLAYRTAPPPTQANMLTKSIVSSYPVVGLNLWPWKCSLKSDTYVSTHFPRRLKTSQRVIITTGASTAELCQAIVALAFRHEPETWPFDLPVSHHPRPTATVLDECCELQEGRAIMSNAAGVRENV